MKKVIKSLPVVLCFCVLLGGCGKEPEGEFLESIEIDSSVEEVDFAASQEFWASQCPVQKGEEGYYYVTPDWLIAYKDMKTGLNIPLCNKPECTHKEKDCNARLSSAGEAAFVQEWNLRYCDGRLYIIVMTDKNEERSAGLFEIQTDGSGIQWIQNLYQYAKGEQDDHYLRHFVTDHGYAYYALLIGMETGSSSYEIYRILLEEGAKPEKIMESSEADAEKDFWIDQFSVWNSKLYFSFRSNDGSKSTLIEYDPGSQKERVVLKGEEIGICAMAKGLLYFAGEEPGIQVLNLETGEIQSLLKSPESLGKGGLGSFCRLSRDGQYLYAHDMNTPDEADETGNRRETAEIFVFDLKGNLVEILEAPNTGESFNAYWSDPDILVIYNSYGYLYYDKQTKEWKERGNGISEKQASVREMLHIIGAVYFYYNSRPGQRFYRMSGSAGIGEAV